jgi:hypothetical protein
VQMKDYPMPPADKPLIPHIVDLVATSAR